MVNLPQGFDAQSDDEGNTNLLIDSNINKQYVITKNEDDENSYFDKDTGTQVYLDDIGISEAQDEALAEGNETTLNFDTPSDEQLLYEENFGESGNDRESRVQAKVDAFGITREEAEIQLDSQINDGSVTIIPNVDDGIIDPNESFDFGKPKKSDEYRVKLTSKSGGETVRFYASPNIDENRTASYDSITPVHHPGPLHVYKSSGPRTFNINGKLIARNRYEATRNLVYMNIIRSWVMPYYGQGTANDPSTKNKLGAPPDILVFSAYGTQNIDQIPTVLTSYSWSYTDNVDYIPTYSGDPLPTIIDITLGLMETWSPEQYSNFDLNSYKLGLATRAFRSGDSTRFSKNNAQNDSVNQSSFYTRRDK